jgi:hypothetical protein
MYKILQIHILLCHYLIKNLKSLKNEEAFIIRSTIIFIFL